MRILCAILLLVLFLFTAGMVELQLELTWVKQAIFGANANNLPFQIARIVGPYPSLFEDKEFHFQLNLDQTPGHPRGIALSRVTDKETRDYYFRRFQVMLTSGAMQLQPNDDAELFIADVHIPGTHCASCPCTLVWLESKRRNLVAVMANSF